MRMKEYREDFFAEGGACFRLFNIFSSLSHKYHRQHGEGSLRKKDFFSFSLVGVRQGFALRNVSIGMSINQIACIERDEQRHTPGSNSFFSFFSFFCFYSFFGGGVPSFLLHSSFCFLFGRPST